jgi:hypothetical protein
MGMAMFEVKRFEVKERRPRNRYPLKNLRKVGDGFIIPKANVPKGSLHGIGRYLGYKLSVTTQKDGSKKVVRIA